MQKFTREEEDEEKVTEILVDMVESSDDMVGAIFPNY